MDSTKFERKVVCIEYPTGKTKKGKDNRTYPETRLLTVGSAFLDVESGRIHGTFLAVPPQWDGKFVMLNPLPKNTEPGEENGGDAPGAE